MRRRPDRFVVPGRANPLPIALRVVRGGALAVALAFGSSASHPALASESAGTGRWHAEIAEASARFGIPVIWIEQVMRAESRGRTVQDGRPITSAAGAMGLMQLMPATWAELRARLGLGSDPHAPRDNILAGTAYLREMYDRFGYPGMFAAYNAGPARYSASLASGYPLPAETRAYLAEVVGGLAGAAPRAVTSTAPPVTRPKPERPPRGGTLDRPAIPQQTIFVALGQVVAESGLSQHRESADRTWPARSGMDSPDGNSGNAMLRTSALTDPLFAVRVAP